MYNLFFILEFGQIFQKKERVGKKREGGGVVSVFFFFFFFFSPFCFNLLTFFKKKLFVRKLLPETLRVYLHRQIGAID